MDAALLDTTFLIDLQRGRRNERRIQAEGWLSEHASTVLKIPVTVLGEFSAGFSDPDDPELVALRQRHEILPVGVKEARQYGDVYRRMKRAGNLIGGNDLWIAVTALVADLPLITRNADHFKRVDGLKVEIY